MNILLLGILTILAIFVISGYCRGFIRKLVGLVSWILIFWLVPMTMPYVSDFLMKNTELYAAIQNSAAQSDTELFAMLRLIGLEDAAGGFVAEKLMQILAFIVTIILVAMVVCGAAAILNLSARLPVLHGWNRFFGAVLGFAEGMLVIWVGSLLICVFAAGPSGEKLLAMVADSRILTWIFTRNPFLGFF